MPLHYRTPGLCREPEALGKEPSAKHLPANDSLPRAPLGKIFIESNVEALSKL